jgi:hypothetical protein
VKPRKTRPLNPRHVTDGVVPVMACYVFGKAAICLEIRGDNR